MTDTFRSHARSRGRTPGRSPTAPFGEAAAIVPGGGRVGLRWPRAR